MSNQNPARVELATDGLSLPRLIVSQEAVIHTRRPECWRSLPEIDAALIDFLCNRGVSGELSPEQTIARLLEYLCAPGNAMPVSWPVRGLHLCEAAVHRQFRSRDVAAVVGCKKHHGLGDLIGRAEPAERSGA